MSIADNPQAPQSAQNRESPRRFYHPELDVLRFAAFCAVFITHAFPSDPEPYTAHGVPRTVAILVGAWVRSGIFGVTLFFLLSSYLITTLLLREHAASGRLDLKAFYIRRTLRIWPLYFFFLALCICILPAFGWAPFRNLNKIGFSIFLGNWSMIFSGVTDQASRSLWSVSVEEQFYLFWPLVLAVFGCGRLRRMAFILMVIATLARVGVVLAHQPGHSIWFNTLVQFDPIAVGALLALAFRDGFPSFSSGARKLLIFAGLAIPPIALAFFDLRGWGILLTYPLVTLSAAAILTGTLTGFAQIMAARRTIGLSRQNILWLVRLSWTDARRRGQDLAPLLRAPGLDRTGCNGCRCRDQLSIFRTAISAAEAAI
jgi:peptidoglycan/LPS O-acetylase OafA/YrhL